MKTLLAGLTSLANDANLIEFISGGDATVANRLASPDAEQVWITFTGIYGDDPGDAAEFFITAIGLRRNWSRMSKMPTTLLDAEVATIGRDAKALARKLTTYSAALRTSIGVLSAPSVKKLVADLRSFAETIRQGRGLTEDMLLRPTKVNAANAETTYCVKALTHYLNDRHKRSDNGLIADTVSAVLDLTEPIDANTVAKLCRTLPTVN